MGRARFAASRSVVDTLADEPFEAFDREAAPRDASCKNYGPRLDDIVVIEVNLTRFRIDAGERSDLMSGPAWIRTRDQGIMSWID